MSALSSCALGLRPARRRGRATSVTVRASSGEEGVQLASAVARLVRLGAFSTEKRAERAVALCDELSLLSERSLVRRLVTLRTYLPPGVDVKALLDSEPSVLCADGVPAVDADSYHESRTRHNLDELAFLPQEVLAVLIVEDPLLLLWVSMQRQSDLRARWESSSLALMSVEERKVESQHIRFEQYVRNFIC